MKKIKTKNFNFKIRKVEKQDKEWIQNLIIKNWSEGIIIVRKKIYRPENLPGFIAIKDNKRLGLVSYALNKSFCRIIALVSLKKKRGIGTRLINKVKKESKKKNLKKILLSTTNDNLLALRFYQRRGFCIKKVYPNIVEEYRKIKKIPKIGKNNIPIRDEIELELNIN